MAEIIKFQPGRPELLALKFSSGRNCDGKFGPQVQYTTTDERTFWLAPEPAGDVERGLRDLGIRAGQLFRLTKCRTSHGGHAWQVSRAEGGDAGGHNVPGRSIETAKPELVTPAAPAAAAPRTTSNSQQSQQQANPTITPLAAKLCGTMCALIDSMREAKAYAQRSGIDLTNEDLRCLVNTAFIQASREGVTR